MKDKNYLIILIIAFIIIALIFCNILEGLGILFLSEQSDNGVTFYKYFNNQTVAVLMGSCITIIIAIVGIPLGFYLWKRQHKKELYDQYIREFIDAVIRWYHIKRGQTRYREQESKGDPDAKQRKEELDIERLKIIGEIDVRKMLLEKYRTTENNITETNKIYEELFDNFGRKEKLFTKIKDKTKEDYKNIKEQLDKSYKKMEKLIEKIRL